MVKRFAFFFFKFIVFLNFLFFKITKRNFLFYLKHFLREDSYQTIKILDQKVSFFVPNSRTKWRIDTFFSKEPETLEWIDNFENGGGGGKKITFWDIGGNIGLYSIYAAVKHRNIDVTTFEPSTSNLQTLSRNISINNLNEKIKICQFPLTNKNNSFLMMKESSLEEGGALNVFGENFDYEGNKFIKKNSYKIYGTSINYLLDNKILEAPDYIKIDVDGIEHLILLGGKKLLKNKNILSIIIEINDKFKKQHRSIFKILKNCNFKLYKKEQNYNLLRSTEYTNTFNYTFVKISKKNS
jgi:FkbM family methyltransferase